MDNQATQEGAAFDLTAFEAADTGILEVQNQKDDGPLLFNGQPVTIELYGPGSEQYAKAQSKVESASQARLFAAARGKAKDAAAEARKDQIDKLVACTKAINNFPLPGGAASLYQNRKLGYITHQVSRYLEDWGNFLSPVART